MKKFTSLVSVLLVFALFQPASSTQLPRVSPAVVKMSSTLLGAMDSVIAASIAKHELPGAVVLVARNGRVVWRRAYGSRAVEPHSEPMTVNTIFDLASLTKV